MTQKGRDKTKLKRKGRVVASEASDLNDLRRLLLVHASVSLGMLKLYCLSIKRNEEKEKVDGDFQI